MAKIFNKILAGVAMLVILLGSGFLLTGCTGDDADKVMNLSINPSIELILDANNKVVSVSANNDEGNFIIANATFVGLTADEAVELFIDINYENGFVVKAGGATADGQLEIEVSGEDAQNLFNQIKTSAKEYLTEIGGNLQIQLEEILDKDDLRDLVEECMGELSEEDIKALSNKELVDLIKQSREETKTFLSEELKEFYYEYRQEEIMKERFVAIQEELASLFSIPGFNLQEMISNFGDLMSAMLEDLTQFKNEFVEKFLSEESQYKTAINDFIEAKKALLEARLEGVDTTALEQSLADAQTALENAETLAEQAIASVETALESAMQALEQAMNVFVNFLNEANITSAIEDAKAEFNAQFKTEFAEYINNNYWTELKPNTAE